MLNLQPLIIKTAASQRRFAELCRGQHIGTRGRGGLALEGHPPRLLGVVVGEAEDSDGVIICLAGSEADGFAWGDKVERIDGNTKPKQAQTKTKPKSKPIQNQTTPSKTPPARPTKSN
jgi:hypothetical protein